MIQCPGCDIVMDDRAILKVLSKDSKLKVRYQQVLINSFVECNNLLKWCPSPNCENVIKVPHVEAKTVTCSCGHSFCFVCVKDQHDPVRRSYFIWLSSRNSNFFLFLCRFVAHIWKSGSRNVLMIQKRPTGSKPIRKIVPNAKLPLKRMEDVIISRVPKLRVVTNFVGNAWDHGWSMVTPDGKDTFQIFLNYLLNKFTFPF